MTQPQFDLAQFLEIADAGTAKVRQLIVDRARDEPRIGALRQRGPRIFGDETRFANWLGRPHPILGQMTPMSILIDGDLTALEDELTRIEHGELNA